MYSPASALPLLRAFVQVLAGKLGMYHDEAGREGGVPSETIEGYLRPLQVGVGWGGGYRELPVTFRMCGNA